MNRRQLVVLWVGVVALAGVCLYPPWVRQSRLAAQEWAPLWVSRPEGAVWVVDYGRLGVELLVLAVVFGAAMLSLKNR